MQHNKEKKPKLCVLNEMKNEKKMQYEFVLVLPVVMPVMGCVFSRQQRAKDTI
jgi:hypothetical protein